MINAANKMTIMKLNKKSMAFSVIIMLIIAIVVGGILFAVGLRFNKLTREKADVNVCRFSIMMNSKTKEAAYSLIKNTQIQCISQEYESEEGATAEDDLNMVAEQLDDCWYQMGAGGLAVFGDYILDGQNHCIVCSEFSVNNEIYTRSLAVQKVLDLKTVMKTRKSKWSSQKSVYEYITFKDESAFDMNIANENSILTIIYPTNDVKENKYLVIYMRHAPSVISDEAQKIFITNERSLAKSGQCDQLFWEKKRKD